MISEQVEKEIPTELKVWGYLVCEFHFFFNKKKWKTFFVSRWIIHFIPGIFFEIRSPSLRKSRLKVYQISLLSQLLSVPHNPCIPDAKSAVFIENSYILGKLHVGMLKYEKEVFLMKLSSDMMFSWKIRDFSKSVVFWVPQRILRLKKRN